MSQRIKQVKELETLKRLAPKEFESLPALAAPAGYICVIRDIDRDRYRIEATRLPQALVDAVLAERERSFGIELVALLQTADLPASEAALFEQHHAQLSSKWLELDALQLEELRKSVLQIDAFASQYLTREGKSLSKAAAPEKPGAHSASPVSFGSSGARWKRRRSRSPLPNVRYGLQGLRQDRAAAEARPRRQHRFRYSTEDKFKEVAGKFLLDHIIVIAVIVFFLFILLVAYAGFSYIYY